MASVPAKVLEYEKFLNETLRSDLKRLLDERDIVYGQIAEYMQLKTSIEKIQECGITENLKTKVDLGCNFYAQANIPDATRVYVFVGFGFFVEMTFSEALKFIDKRTAFLQGHADRLTADAMKVRANINLVLEGLRELQNISNVEEKQFRDIWS